MGSFFYGTNSTFFDETIQLAIYAPEELLLDDLMHKEFSEKKIFKNFKEAKITFPPTYKYEKDSNFYSQKSIPYFSDRIFYFEKNFEELKPIYYNTMHFVQDSTHKPLYFTAEAEIIKKTVSTPKKGFQMRKTNKNMIEKPFDTNHWELTDFIFKEKLEISEDFIIYKVVHKFSKKEYAAKVIKIDKFKDNSKSTHLTMEIDSPFIIKSHRIFIKNGYYVIIKDLLEHEDLFSCLKKIKLNESETKFFVGQVVLALKTLHKMNIVHRDIRPENLKFTSKGYLKLAGFNFPKIIVSRSFTKVGTIDYLSPEMILNTGHSKGVDFWSLGILTFELLCGYPPFISLSDNNELAKLDRILSGKIHFPEFLSKDARSFISELLQKNKSKRLGCLKGGIDDVMNHPWLKGVDWNLLEKMDLKSPYSPEKLKSTFKEDNNLFDDFISEFTSSTETNSHDEFIETEDFFSFFSLSSNESIKYGRILQDHRSDSIDLNIGDVVEIISMNDEKSHVIYGDKKIILNVPVEEVVLFKDRFINKKRVDILNEFLLTEKTYVTNLYILIEHFYNPLLKILSPEVHQKIFSSIQTIFKVNSTFFQSLQASLIKDDGFTEAPKTILSYVHSFKLYTFYIQNYNISFNTLQSEKAKNVKLKQFLQQNSIDLANEGVLNDINSYMIMPVQRLPRYQLLCEDLLKNTPKDQIENIEKACKEIRDIVSYCNAKTREYESLYQSFQYQRRFSIPIDNTREFLFEKKPTDIIYAYENEQMKHIFEFAILKGIILIELKSKRKMVFEYNELNYKEIEIKETPGFEIYGMNNSKLILLFDDTTTFMKYQSQFQNFK